jgi:sterol desaturase/sphingolipid hydroxylase (fatty acid hydroxylase superfamily)
MTYFLSFGFSKAGLIACVLISLFLAERLWPMTRNNFGMPRLVKNFSLAALNAIASPLVVIPLTALIASHAPLWRPDVWPSIWNGWPALIIDLLILDLWIYLWHRINHQLPVLWRFHQVHHLDETLDTSSGLRFHVGEVILSSIIRAAVIFALAIPLQTVIIFETMIAVAALFHHSNVSLPAVIERPLSKLIVTPSIHWVHHHAIRSDTDSNYSTVLSIWDVIFRTRSQTRRTPELPVGVERTRDRSIWQLLLTPFMWKA